MAENVSADLLLEHFRRMNSRFDRLDEKLDVLAADMRTMKTHMAGFMGTEALQDTTIAGLSARIDRIERRLDLRDQ